MKKNVRKSDICLVLTDKRSYAQNCEAKIILDRSVLTEGQGANQATRQPPRWPSRHCGVGFGWLSSNPVGIWAPAYTQELYGPQRYWLFELGSKRVGLETIWIEVTHVLLSRVIGPTKRKAVSPFFPTPFFIFANGSPHQLFNPASPCQSAYGLLPKYLAFIWRLLDICRRSAGRTGLVTGVIGFGRIENILHIQNQRSHYQIYWQAPIKETYRNI